MKHLFTCIFVFLISTNFIFGQFLTDFTKKKDSLNLIIENIDSLINKLESEKLRLQKQLSDISQEASRNEIQQQFSKGFPITINFMGGILRDKPSGIEIIKIPPGDTVTVLDWYEQPYFKVIYKDKIGFLSYMCFNNNEIIKSKIKSKTKTSKPKVSRLTSLYGYEIARKIENKQYWLGMTTEMAIESLGYPSDINKSVTSWGVHEQWIYDSKELYLYFENGILTSYQK